VPVGAQLEVFVRERVETDALGGALRPLQTSARTTPDVQNALARVELPRETKRRRVELLVMIVLELAEWSDANAEERSSTYKTQRETG
jgi:hypothetical protein